VANASNDESRLLLPAESLDPDIRLLDRHFVLHLSGTVGAGIYGTGVLAAGADHFMRFANGEPTFLIALALTSLGAATVVSGATSVEAHITNWLRTRERLEQTEFGGRGLILQAEARRLKRMVRQRAIGVGIDSAFLGVGIALMALIGPELGALLVANGAVLLGIDIYRLVVDDQVARRWRSRSSHTEPGYFSDRSFIRPGPRGHGIQVAIQPLISGETFMFTGLSGAIAGRF